MFSVTNLKSTPLFLAAVDGSSVAIPGNATVVVDSKYLFPNKPSPLDATISTEFDLSYIPDDLLGISNLITALSSTLAKALLIAGTSQIPQAPLVSEAVVTMTATDDQSLNLNLATADPNVVITVSSDSPVELVYSP